MGVLFPFACTWALFLVVMLIKYSWFQTRCLYPPPLLLLLLMLHRRQHRHYPHPNQGRFARIQSIEMEENTFTLDGRAGEESSLLFGLDCTVAAAACRCIQGFDVKQN